MKIKSIKRVEPRTVYAVTTSTETFIADGLAHHNCWGCNGFGGGKLLDFEEHLIEEIGAKRVAELKASRHKVIKLSTNWYEEQIQIYKDKLKELNV